MQTVHLLEASLDYEKVEYKRFSHLEMPVRCQSMGDRSGVVSYRGKH